ncbi:hypothetical protein RRG08_047656 [Elysia crispata]|uniref:Uncharacterized protein n=1 Tax=Elysia crispata TaxID=231223 RepID=A0AAE0ZXH9_9GAST|nr:hypothetical protein RRG08_047656 [Elysia crispata]
MEWNDKEIYDDKPELSEGECEDDDDEEVNDDEEDDYDEDDDEKYGDDKQEDDDEYNKYDEKIKDEKNVSDVNDFIVKMQNKEYSCGKLPDFFGNHHKLPSSYVWPTDDYYSVHEVVFFMLCDNLQQPQT